MQTILCPICEEDNTFLIARRREQGLTVATVECRQCGLVYHNPVIEDQDRQKAAVSSRQWHTDSQDNTRQLRKLEKRWQLQWPMIQPVFSQGRRVLEIGCGLGLVGGRLQSQGAEVWAVEPDPDQAAYARQHYGLEVVPLHFEDISFETQQFDLMLASHVIEHFPEPLAFLRQLRAYAHPETRLFLETPNILASKVSYRRMFSLAHNFYFAPQTLGWLLAKAGWQEEKLRVFR
ncbi:MAG: class I SAM-dependent methyltransferase, partial [Deltaproteobacteria bacterium]